MRRTMLLVLAAGAAAPCALGQIAFQPRVDFATPERPDGIAAADFTGDGLVDLAVITDNPDKITLLVGDGARGFATGPTSLLGSGAGADAATASDVDGDGDMDVVVTLDGPNQVQAMLNDGTGRFAIGPTAPVGEDPRWIAAGRLNANPGADFVVVNRDGNSVTVVLDLGATTTTTSTIPAGDEPRAAAIGDFNADGNADFAVTNSRGRSVLIFTGDGAGGFTAGQVVPVGADVRPEGIVAADFDGDGDTDLAATVDGFVGMLRNDAGVFSTAGRFPVASADPSSIYIGNFLPGGPGPDVVTVNDDASAISVLANTGSLTLGAPLVLSTGLDPQFAAVADFDASGAMDVAVTNQGANSTSLYLNAAARPCAGDFDGDGELTLFDFLDFQTAFDDRNPRADIDGDGAFTVFDFLDFQNLFAAGCP